MNRQTALQIEQAIPMSPLLAAGILQRKCACGQHTISGGECDECGKKQLSLQRATRNSESEAEDSAAVTHAFAGVGLKNDFSHVPVSIKTKTKRQAKHDFAGSSQPGTFGGGVTNGLLDERLTISPEFDPDIGERRPTSGRLGPGLTPPPMITPAYGTCPSATVVERTIDMTPGGLALGYRTGYGITAIMRVLPGGTNWDATSITERLSVGSSTCPANWNLCTGASEFFVGAPRYSTVLGVLAGRRNRFFDFHTSRWNQSRLHDATQNPAGLNSCQAVCQQEYLCGGNVIGRHTITRTFRKSVDAGGRPITIVDATKT